VEFTPLYDGSSETPRKNMLPVGEQASGCYSLCGSYITHFPQKSKP
jgi:hypothetical protein